MSTIRRISIVLLIIGGLNWGLFGLFGIDLVAFLPGILATIVYVLVGIAAIVEIIPLPKESRNDSISESQSL